MRRKEGKTSANKPIWLLPTVIASVTILFGSGVVIIVALARDKAGKQAKAEVPNEEFAPPARSPSPEPKPNSVAQVKVETPDKPKGWMQPKEWEEYAPREGGFAVALPTNGNVISTSRDVALPGGGSVKFHMHGIDGRRSEADQFMTIHSEYPLAMFRRGADSIFSHAKFALLRALTLEARVVSEKEITLDGHPGREWRVKVEEFGAVTARVYLVKNKLIQVYVGGTPGRAAYQKDVADFFYSLRLISK